MSPLTFSKLIGFAFLAIVALASVSAVAKECKWDGTPPFCEGSCPDGWKFVKQKACFSGFRVYCCKNEPKCGPAQYGTEGCPYPPFGSAPDSGEKPPSGPTADSIMENQKQKGSGKGSSGVLVPEQSTGPSPFGNPAGPDVEVLPAPSDAMNSRIIEKVPLPEATNPCGSGMYKGGDGQCYPKLN